MKEGKLRIVCDTNVLLSMLGCALSAKAQVLVTGNFRDLIPLKRFRDIEILSPRAFLDKYFPIH